jgi:HK97 family phage major capsid protein
MTIPQTGAELNEFLNDQVKVERAVKEGQLAEVVKAYAAASMKKDREAGDQIREQVQASIREFLVENGQEKQLERLNKGGIGAVVQSPRSALYNSKAAGAKLDRDYDGSADFFRTIWHNTNRMDPEVNAKLTRLRNAASTTDPAGGGFLVPEVLRSELQALALEQSVVRGRARVIPMETSRVGFPAVDSSSNVSSVYGGIVGYWTEEGGTFTESEPSFEQIFLDAKKLATYSVVNNELLTDSGASFEAFANQAFPQAIAYYEDDAFLNGNGVGQPKGIYKANAVVSVPRGTTNEIAFADVANMYSRLLPQSMSRAVWVIAPDALPQLLQMALVSGSTPVAPPLWLPGQSAHGAPQYTLMGLPVVVSEKAPKLGAAGDLALFDFGYYLIGDRQAMTASSSAHYKFQNDQTAFKIVTRVDGKAWLQSAITPRNASTNTLSPFVTLKATTS